MFGFTTAILATSGMAHAQVTAPTGNVEAGTNVFKKCRACHKVGPDAKNGVGPMLNGIVGRAAGANPGYGYSSAMKNSGLVWDEPTLTTYLHAPRALVPHTKMSFPGLPKDQDIADVIAYLKQFNADGQSTAKP
ncbi:cytochrome c family protein (plasmid) [Phyllobacterium sp. A18/5-2]|uniref:c-type cytochrome n=1 Tax=Phyllobacterium sp. A18/5-2 TaxID=2978392 RepID=UPI0021C7503B|nr:cytochrome c family protein [Phyllobacterium sp. A18/5-2]UXN66103.1 cytochrome c family protein [Phyllobacterium sp. A18/5-2]